MKKVFVLVLCLILVVACFSGCGNREERFVYSEEGGFYHSLGDLTKLDVGFYQVKHFFPYGEEILTPVWLEVSDNANYDPELEKYGDDYAKFAYKKHYYILTLVFNNVNYEIDKTSITKAVYNNYN